MALDYARDNMLDPYIASYIAVPYLFNRLASPFQDIRPNISVMRLIHISCSVDCCDEEYDKICCRVVQSLISSRFIRNVCLWFGYPAIDESGLWNDDLSQLLVSIMDLFIIIDKYDGNSEEILGAWRTYFDLLNALPVEFWRQMPARNWLEEMARRLEHLGNSRSHNVTSQIYESNSAREKSLRTEEVPGMKQNDVLEEVFAPALWEECEKRPPPCDYRELCEMPVMKDICNAEASYLRRAIISGHYQDAAHYLDVQFRLFREDLVSPLRDGLAVYKLNGKVSLYNLFNTPAGHIKL
ncbi:unnamed protein product [Strongylus vulgaris]|uniref:Uncharacterized protein n=1 Tax=Strongylus vulgaris TaxID=40348 RepID=A0A3P7I831_STRVU|nr:unnamed protein product [Strongylus vulgaris]